MTETADSLAALTAEIREFARERDWEQFHDPKSLLLALVGEVGELAELFQWVPAADAVTAFADPERKQRAKDEIADVLTYLLRLADVLDIDIAEATAAKLEDSRIRFMPDAVRGIAPHID
ncbi:nucleotide pyrophosphohydrolase [Demequina sp. NBRC 110055]|uniref:nucleotide pyrophosphohydrolase n=1 Tax=Demequina sp. NBRC 110055 TaxID=1570344 RepID=UPI001F2EEF57|nr:nucleotide pyrophosphohydrolase [Demequina sp. NBRC 110055]